MSMLHQLIAIPSMSSVNPSFDTSNRAVIDLLACWYEALGFTVQVMPLPRQPHKANLIATIGPAQEHGKNQGIMLAGHTDTVPCEEKFWRFHPFRLTEQENRLYGLGTTDMKSFFALIIEAFKRFDASRFKQPLVVLATADEESSMEGAAMLIQETSLPVRSAVIGEPTGLKPVNAHKGMIMNGIRLIGRGGHSSNPALGVSALEGMHLVIGEILAWRRELQSRYCNPLFEVDVPTLNLGHIHGGDNPNRICGQCELQIDLRPLPGMQLDALRGELAARLEQLLDKSELKLELIPSFAGIPAMETDADAAIVRTAEALTGYPAGAVAFGTEAPYLNRLGAESIILGPGDIDQAHQPDEYLGLERIQPMIDILQQLIKRFCL